MLPMMTGCLWLLWRCTGLLRWAAVCLLVPLLLLSYGRFVEPNLLVVQHHSTRAPFQLKIALISDIHVGLFSTERQLQRLVDRLNTLDVDEVWVAGDWSYHPPFEMDRAFAALGQLRHPVLSVPGNHDAQRPGPPLQAALRKTQQKYGVQYLENGVVDRADYRLIGLGSAWAFEANFGLLATPSDKPTVVLAHNPDVVNFYPEPAFLTLTGHTHGGQVNLPWLTERVLKGLTMAGVDQGWYRTPGGPMFVTRGIGMLGLPVRFNSVPVIDVIELSPAADVPQLQDAMQPQGRFKGW